MKIQMKSIYQIKLHLKGVKPQIWRRLIIPSEASLPELHKIIQTSMGWTNTHLHQFIRNKKIYSARSDDDFIDNSNDIDYSNLRVKDLLTDEKDKITYEYDFGDDWEHEIVLEKIKQEDKRIKYPVCIGGERNCPPEDCGGIGGYHSIIEMLKDPNDPNNKEMIEWLGDNFDPEYFNKEEANELLLSEDFGCPMLED